MVILINGSPMYNGSTKRCLELISSILSDKGVDNEIVDVPNDIHHCINCRICKDTNSVCKADDFLPSVASKIEKCDGIIIGSHTYYYSITSQLQAFLTRLCYSKPMILKNKLCSFFSVSRRSGNTNCLDQVNKIFQMHGAIMFGTNYVNEIYADNPNELEFDKEGMLTLRYIANNYAILLPILKDVKLYDEKKVHTNFISREFLNLVKTNSNNFEN